VRPVPDGRIKHGACGVDTVAGVQQALDALIVFRPQFDFVEVPLVRVVPIGCRFRCEVCFNRHCGLAPASQSHSMLRVAREDRGQALWKVAVHGESGAHATQFQSCSASRFTAGAAGFLTP
jgi:hypothetical protein